MPKLNKPVFTYNYRHDQAFFIFLPPLKKLGNVEIIAASLQLINSLIHQTTHNPLLPEDLAQIISLFLALLYPLLPSNAELNFSFPTTSSLARQIDAEHSSLARQVDVEHSSLAR